MEVRELLERLLAALRERDAFRAEFLEVLEHYEQLCEAVRVAEAELAEALAARGVDYVENDSLAVQVIRPDRGHFIPQLLPEWVQDIPGVLETRVNAEAVRKLVRAGLLSEEVAQRAWVSKPARPYLRVQVVETVAERKEV